MQSVAPPDRHGQRRQWSPRHCASSKSIQKGDPEIARAVLDILSHASTLSHLIIAQIETAFQSGSGGGVQAFVLRRSVSVNPSLSRRLAVYAPLSSWHGH
jgi:hypothetical protein